ncbi:hypothetical protein CCHR01_16681 [Colletotrichum chrysophilum]|uniref:Uncharacterized protein n=1 Tax=Colletotrichum chrysophilum TaxID=1836956 RepID=A0AAD9A3R8_9PEZI|nr:hypothetical protein CCHR01_16681 [Colletotrichum chrysophilum]
MLFFRPSVLEHELSCARCMRCVAAPTIDGPYVWLSDRSDICLIWKCLQALIQNEGWCPFEQSCCSAIGDDQTLTYVTFVPSSLPFPANTLPSPQSIEVPDVMRLPFFVSSRDGGMLYSTAISSTSSSFSRPEEPPSQSPELRAFMATTLLTTVSTFGRRAYFGESWLMRGDGRRALTGKPQLQGVPGRGRVPLLSLSVAREHRQARSGAEAARARESCQKRRSTAVILWPPVGTTIDWACG